MAIVSALEYNTFFRGLKVTHSRLSHETLERILHVLRRSLWLEELHLEALGLRWVQKRGIDLGLILLTNNYNGFRSDFLHKLAVSVISNTNPALQTINLSHNLIEDKGMIDLFWFVLCVGGILNKTSWSLKTTDLKLLTLGVMFCIWKIVV